MSHTTEEYSTAGVCGSGSQIVYAWAMDAPSLTLPKGKTLLFIMFTLTFHGFHFLLLHVYPNINGKNTG